MPIRTIKAKVSAFEDFHLGRVVIVWNGDDVDAGGLVADLLAEGSISTDEQIVCVTADQIRPVLH